VTRGERAAGPVRQRDRLGHRHGGEGHERHDVERADPRMDAVMLAHVHLGQHRLGEGQQRLRDRSRRPQEREDRPVVIGIGVDVGERDPGRRRDGGSEAG
jgi:hypothetical protein